MNDPDPDVAQRAANSASHLQHTPVNFTASGPASLSRLLKNVRAFFAKSPGRRKNAALKLAHSRAARLHGQDLLSRSQDLEQLTVSELMRPAHEMVYLSAEHDTEYNLALIQRTRFSRYPYFADDGETLLGMVHFKDLFPLGAPGVDFPSILRKALVVPPDTPVPDLFKRFRQGASHFALVGYPGEHPAGFLTIDNLLGALVGEIRDEFRHDGGNWNRLDDGSLLGKGSMSLFSLKHALGIELPELSVDSVSGLVMDRLGRLPKEGERIAFQAFDIVIKRMRGPRIQLLKIIPPQPLADLPRRRENA
jgi:CBS domain containing-hemolysin-like protein